MHFLLAYFVSSFEVGCPYDKCILKRPTWGLQVFSYTILPISPFAGISSMSGRSSDFTAFVLCCFAVDTSLDCFCCCLAADISLFFLVVETFGFWTERAWLSRFRLVAGVFFALLLRSPKALLGVVVGWVLKVFPGCTWTGFTVEEQISAFISTISILGIHGVVASTPPTESLGYETTCI